MMYEQRLKEWADYLLKDVLHQVGKPFDLLIYKLSQGDQHSAMYGKLFGAQRLVRATARLLPGVP